MFVLKIDLSYLHIHAGIFEDKKSPHGSMYWRCLYTHKIIEWLDIEMLVKDKNKIFRQIISRPYCPKCKPEAAKYPHLKFPDIDEPIAKQQIIEVLW